ncbi:MAG: hypothetical protein ACE5R6_15345 [Candidatus Heimdallarchaeota archaeon]
MVSKKKIAELSKKKIQEEIKKHKNTLKERSPLEKAKHAYHTSIAETAPTEDAKDIEKSESPIEPKPTEPKPEVSMPDLSKMIDKGYEKLHRTSRGLAAATSVFLGETLGIDTSVESKDSESPADVKNDQIKAVVLARKILERKKEERRDSTE